MFSCMYPLISIRSNERIVSQVLRVPDVIDIFEQQIHLKYTKKHIIMDS